MENILEISDADESSAALACLGGGWLDNEDDDVILCDGSYVTDDVTDSWTLSDVDR